MIYSTGKLQKLTSLPSLTPSTNNKEKNIVKVPIKNLNATIFPVGPTGETEDGWVGRILSDSNSLISVLPVFVLPVSLSSRLDYLVFWFSRFIS